MWRQLRISALAIAVVLALVVRVGVSSFYASGGVKGMASMNVLLRNPAIASLYGRTTSITSAGGLVAWKLGMFMALTVAVWGALISTRLTRGAEDDQSWDLLVVGVTSRRTTLGTALAVLVEAGVAVGVVVFVALASGSQDLGRSLLFACALSGVTWFGAAVGVVSSQLVAPRRSATQVAIGVVGVTYLIRMLADAANSNGWLRWITPFGWQENVDAFGRTSSSWLAMLVAVPLALALLSFPLQERRDVGAASWTRSDRSLPRTALLSSSWRFAWRERRSTLAVWTAGLALFGLIIGYLTNALVAFCRSDPAYVRLLDHWGLGAMATSGGFIAEVCLMMAPAVALFAVTLVAMVASDGLQGRLTLPFAYGTSRLRWMTSSIVAALVGALAASVACALAVWIGVTLSGTRVSIVGPLEGMLNTMSVVPLVVGVTVVLVAWWPRFAYVVMASLTAVCYLIALLGPIERWPSWLIDASPFHFIHLVPFDGANWASMMVFAALALASAGVGLLRFSRADVVH